MSWQWKTIIRSDLCKKCTHKNSGDIFCTLFLCCIGKGETLLQQIHTIRPSGTQQQCCCPVALNYSSDCLAWRKHEKRGISRQDLRCRNTCLYYGWTFYSKCYRNKMLLVCIQISASRCRSKASLIVPEFTISLYRVHVILSFSATFYLLFFIHLFVGVNSK